MLSEKPWKFEAVLRLALWLLVSLGTGAWALMLWAPRTAPEEPVSLLAVAIGMLSFHGIGIVLIQFLVREHGTTWREAFGLAESLRWQTLALTVALTCLALPIALGLGNLSATVMEQLHWKPEVQGTVRTLQAAGVPLWQKAALGVLAIGVAPLAEEALFRGVCYPTLCRLGSRRLAAGASAVLFGLAHGNAMIFVPLVFLALVLTWLYETTSNLLAPVLAHSLFNAANFVWLMRGHDPGF